jgi:hypothetical protein
MSNNLQDEFKYYVDHQKELAEKYNGKIIVIKDRQVIGVYDSEIRAVEETKKKHTLGTFLVQKCELGPESYTQTFHSRVAFA